MHIARSRRCASAETLISEISTLVFRATPPSDPANAGVDFTQHDQVEALYAAARAVLCEEILAPTECTLQREARRSLQQAAQQAAATHSQEVEVTLELVRQYRSSLGARAGSLVELRQRLATALARGPLVADTSLVHLRSATLSSLSAIVNVHSPIALDDTSAKRHFGDLRGMNEELQRILQVSGGIVLGVVIADRSPPAAPPPTVPPPVAPPPASMAAFTAFMIAAAVCVALLLVVFLGSAFRVRRRGDDNNEWSAAPALPPRAMPLPPPHSQSTVNWCVRDDELEAGSQGMAQTPMHGGAASPLAKRQPTTRNGVRLPPLSGGGGLVQGARVMPHVHGMYGGEFEGDIKLARSLEGIDGFARYSPQVIHRNASNRW